MLSILLAVLCITSIAIALAILLQKKFLQTLFLAVVLVILVLFLCGLLNFDGCLLLGYYLVIALSITCAVYSGLRLVRDRKLIREIGLLPGLAIMGVLLGFSFFMNHGRWFTGWDEFSHWGIVVKHMFSFDALGTISNSELLFKGYLPGSSLLQYFFTRANGEFVEYATYVACNMMYFSMVVAIFKKINVKAIIFALVALTLPEIVGTLFYSSVYVDLMMGCLFGFAIIYYFLNRYEEDLYGILSVAAAILLLCIIKDVGFILALLCVAIIVVDIVLFRRKEVWRYLRPKKKLLAGRVALVSMPAIAIVVSQIVWRGHLAITGVSSNWDLSKMNIAGFFNGSLLDYQKETVRLFVGRFFNVPVTPFAISFFWIMVIVFAVGLIWSLLIKNRLLASRLVAGCVLVFLGALGYALMMLILYTFVFPEYEALILASYDRYVSTYLIGSLLVLLFIVTKRIRTPAHLATARYERGAWLLVAMVAFLALRPILFTRTLPVFANSREMVESSVAMRDDYEVAKQWAPCLADTSDRFSLIAQGSNGFEMYVIHHTFYPFKVQTEYAYDFSVATEAYYPELNDPWTFVIEPEAWGEYMLERYTLVYVFKYDELFERNYGYYFDELKNNQLYRVTTVDGEMRLVQMEVGCA